MYRGQNILAKSLEEQCYHSHPSFLSLKEDRNLPFKPHPTFKKADLDDRQQLYKLLCKEIWSPQRFDRELV
ncbi:MAG TPA: hypothetical protein VJO32_09100 [Ktedonobacteraceae bacterium]|nr:hypothetical protein [Ktedonobacteraceae bacterium]